MAGERYSHSLDIGEELEKEKAEEKKGEQQPLPCFCNPKIKPKPSEKEEAQDEKKEAEEPAQEPAKEGGQEDKEESAAKEEPSEQEVSDKQEVAKEAVPGQPPEQKSAEQTQPHIEVKPADIPEEDVSGWEPWEEETPAEPQSPPDPVEEDVNAIITKDIPVLHARKSLLEQVFEHKFLLLVVFVALVAGIFLAWKLILPEQEIAGQQFQFEPSAAFVPANITLFPEVPETPEFFEPVGAFEPAMIPEPAEPVEAFEPAEMPEPSEAAVEETVPAPSVVKLNASSVDELPDFLAQQLKD